MTVVYQVFIFRRIKINHESHEFILDSGTVVNKSLRDILDKVYFCNESDQPFDLLKEVLLGQF